MCKKKHEYTSIVLLSHMHDYIEKFSIVSYIDTCTNTHLLTILCGCLSIRDNVRSCNVQVYESASIQFLLYTSTSTIYATKSQCFFNPPFFTGTARRGCALTRARGTTEHYTHRRLFTCHADDNVHMPV